jgi:hypothetical protein
VAISVMGWVWDHSRSRHGARLVLLAIADCVKTDGGWAWPSSKELQRKTNLTERAVRMAVAELTELGELAVDLNSGPGGCNRYRIITAPPAKIAPGKDCPPEIFAPRQNLPPSESAQASDQDPANFAPPAENAPRQNLHHPPAENAPGTVSEPEVKISPSERSNPPESGDAALFDAASNGHPPQAAKPKRGRPAGQKASDPRFAEWYAAYPVHKAPGDAEKAYAKVIREGADPLLLLEAAKRYCDEQQVLDGYGKHPATWLNKKCWLDEATPPPRPRTPPVGVKRTNYSDEEYHDGW